MIVAVSAFDWLCVCVCARDTFCLSLALNIRAGMPPPTAIAWLRRRGPENMPHNALYRAFRKDQVRGTK
jgi:hypothetical protein